MAKAEIRLDIAESNVQLAMNIIEAWLNYDSEHREITVGKNRNGMHYITLCKKYDEEKE